jgi:hypothetical protein
MPRNSLLAAVSAALLLALGCSGGDLTLPGSGAPAALAVVSGDGQQAKAGTELEEPLTVELLDDSARPVQGVTVQFSFVGDVPGAKVDPASVLTDENGRAAAVVRLGRVVGEQGVVAQVPSLADLRARFTAISVAPGGDGHDGGSEGSDD